MSAFATVFRKELLDNLRDRRTLLSSFSIALLGPLFFVGLMAFMLDTAIGESSEPVSIDVIGAEHAPNLIGYLHTSNVDTNSIDLEDPALAVRSGEHSVILVIPNDYGADLASGEVAQLRIVHDSSAFGSARRGYRAAQSAINAYSRSIGLRRLMVRGVDVNVIDPIDVTSIDTASPGARALTVLATLPYLLLFVVFMGGFYLAIDSTAGERERGSLEPLLTQPVDRGPLVLGKIGASATFALMSLLLFLIAFTLSLPMVPLEKLGVALTMTATKAGSIVVLCLPLLVMAAALLVVVASFAKSYKEAQTYLSIVILIPTLPAIVISFLDIEPGLPIMMIPSVSQALLVSDIISGDPIANSHVAVSMLATTVAAAALCYLATVLYKREAILG
ncbi:MAG: ABC transporter permease [Pseudomonadaceae bacterium]|nr:ABC transporter permease [Pseudomonadaceae bacterium]